MAIAYARGSAAEADYLKRLQAQADAEEQARFAAQSAEQSQRQGILDSLKAADDQRQAGLDIEQRVREETAKRTLSRNQGILDSLYSKVRQAGTENINRDAAEQRRKLVAEENALGRLQSPVSIPTLARVDDARSRALALFEGQVAGQQANQQADISKTIENILGQESQFARSFAQNAGQFDRTLQNQQQQFGQTLDFNKGRALAGDNQWNRAFQSSEEQRGIDNSLGIQALQEMKIGNARANEAKKPGFLEYLNTAFTGLQALPGIGEVIGTAGKIGTQLASQTKKPTAGVGGTY